MARFDEINIRKNDVKKTLKMTSWEREINLKSVLLYLIKVQEIITVVTAVNQCFNIVFIVENRLVTGTSWDPRKP